MADGKVPVTVLTGFLGSGKTTLLNHILTQEHGKKLAVIENEFGDVGIDDALLQKNTKMQADEEIIEMMNGCICCTVRQDLIVVLKKLCKRVQSGQAQARRHRDRDDGHGGPGAGGADLLRRRRGEEAFARLDGIVTLVDAKHIEQHLDEEKPEGAENESVEQVAFADRLLLNKCDLVTEEELTRVEKRLKEINKFAPILRTTKAEVSADSVLDIKGFDLGARFEFLTAARSRWTPSSSTPTASMIFNGDFTEAWLPGEERTSKLVFIGKNLDHDVPQARLHRRTVPDHGGDEGEEAQVAPLRHRRQGAVQDGRRLVEGQVVQLMWRAPGCRPAWSRRTGRLESGDLIYAPHDDDQLIRKQA